MYSVTDVPTLPGTGFPIQKSPDQSLFSSSPKLIAACHVFHRLLTPRHPPFALNSLATKQLTQSYQTFSCTYKQIVKEQCEDNLYKKNNCLLFKKAARFSSLLWWRWTGSNRWPPACKAGALPTELHPRKTWWAWMELNHRPHAYQACALTELSYRPKDQNCPFNLLCSSGTKVSPSSIQLNYKRTYLDLSKLNSDK